MGNSANNKTIRYLSHDLNMESVALVTGCSSGIGLETAIALGREGHFTYATMRDLKKSGNLD